MEAVGTKAELTPTGFNLGSNQAVQIDVPKELLEGPALLPLPTPRGLTPPVPVVVSELSQAIEAGDAPGEAVRGQSISLPVALSGRLEQANDIDAFLFEAKKGRTYTFEVMARRVGSIAASIFACPRRAAK